MTGARRHGPARRAGLLKRLFYLPFRFVLRRRPVPLPLDASRIRRILVLRYDRLGDLLVTTPVFSVLKRCLPGASVDVVASARNAQLLDADPRVDRVYVYRRTLPSFAGVWWRCRDRRYDCVLALVFNRTTVAGLLASAWGGRQAVTVAIRHREREHLYRTWFNVQVEIARNRQTMAAMQVDLVRQVFGLEIEPAREPLCLHLTDGHRAFAAAALAPLAGRRVVALNISAGAPEREWSEAANAAFLRQLLARVDDHVLIIASPKRSETARRLAVIDDRRVSVLPGTSDFRNVIATLRHLQAVISPDTAVVHAAACAKTPVVVLCSRKTSFLNEWMPHAVPYEAVFTDGRLDIETIRPDAVVDAYERLRRRVPGFDGGSR